MALLDNNAKTPKTHTHKKKSDDHSLPGTKVITRHEHIYKHSLIALDMYIKYVVMHALFCTQRQNSWVKNRVVKRRYGGRERGMWWFALSPGSNWHQHRMFTRPGNGVWGWAKAQPYRHITELCFACCLLLIHWSCNAKHFLHQSQRSLVNATTGWFELCPILKLHSKTTTRIIEHW